MSRSEITEPLAGYATVAEGAGARTPSLSPPAQISFAKSQQPWMQRVLASAAVALGLLLIWWTLCKFKVLNSSVFPTPGQVARALKDEMQSGRLWDDLIASLFRVATGFLLAVILAIPVGLWLGSHAIFRAAWLPVINFMRSLSPLAWIPFAIVWFGIGDASSIFLIFIATFFPLALATLSAVAGIPRTYFRVASDYGITGVELLTKVTLPAVLPQVITALRVTAGLAWLVVVAAEMIAGHDGLGFAIWDARNGLRMDLLVAEMLVIGVMGIGIDALLLSLTKFSGVRWGYEQ
jgi:NitT/TauT family transport system permease protein